MTDFFISYTHADERWAEWIAYVLEEEGYTTVIQAWDFRPGSNFVLEMQQAAALATRTIMVLSPDYLDSKMAAPEWASAFSRDPEGLARKLVPVMVRKCDSEGLLPTIVQIRIMDMPEDAARHALLSGVNQSRAKPSSRPGFPGASTHHSEEKNFPGTKIARPENSLIPDMPRRMTDMDRRRFLKQGLETIRAAFEENIRQVTREEPRLEADFAATSKIDFSTELFLDGKSKCRCRIWLSHEMGSDSIGFQEGNTSGNAYNEILHLSSDGHPAFEASMAIGVHGIERNWDMKRLSAQDAAAYLWTRFVSPLSR